MKKMLLSSRFLNTCDKCGWLSRGFVPEGKDTLPYTALAALTIPKSVMNACVVKSSSRASLQRLHPVNFRHVLQPFLLVVKYMHFILVLFLQGRTAALKKKMKSIADFVYVDAPHDLPFLIKSSMSASAGCSAGCSQDSVVSTDPSQPVPDGTAGALST